MIISLCDCLSTLKRNIMKNLLFIFLFLFSYPSIVLSSDNEQKYKLALERIANNDFTIIITEVYNKNNQYNITPEKMYTDCYLTVKGTQSVLRIDPQIDERNSYIIDTDSSVENISKPNAKDKIYIIKLCGEQSWQNMEARVTLYKNSNICYVQIISKKYRNEKLGMKGYIDIENSEVIKQ